MPRGPVKGEDRSEGAGRGGPDRMSGSPLVTLLPVGVGASVLNPLS